MCTALQAQPASPSKPIKIGLPFPAAGTSDVLAWLVGQKMTEAWDQPVVVENKPGLSGNWGAESVAKIVRDEKEASNKPSLRAAVGPIF